MTARFIAPKPTVSVAALSKKQEGVFELSQAERVGVSERQLRRMVDNGELVRPYRGVFIDAAVPATPMQAVIAAKFAVGTPALASHRLVTWLWGLVDRRTPEALEFTVPRSRAPRPPGVNVYRVSTMPPASLWRGIQVTSPLRALLDLAAVAPEQVVGAIIRGVLTVKLFTPKAIEAELNRAAVKGKPGVTALRAALGELGVGRYTPSELERRSRRLFRAYGLPDPQVEIRFGEHGDYRLDFYWPEADLVVEVDGWSFHADPVSRRRDFTKQNSVVRSGRWILRYDWFQVVHADERTATEIVDTYRTRTQLYLG